MPKVLLAVNACINKWPGVAALIDLTLFNTGDGNSMLSAVKVMLPRSVCVAPCKLSRPVCAFRSIVPDPAVWIWLVASAKVMPPCVPPPVTLTLPVVVVAPFVPNLAEPLKLMAV